MIPPENITFAIHNKCITMLDRTAKQDKPVRCNGEVKCYEQSAAEEEEEEEEEE